MSGPECPEPNSSAEDSGAAPPSFLFFLLLLGLLASGLFSGCSQLTRRQAPQAAKTAASEIGSVRLASWNVRNLFDSVDDPNNDEVPTPAELKLKLRETAEVLQKLDADFVALEEVENVGVLEQLNKTLPEAYPYLFLVEGNDKGRGIDVGYLSRIPVDETVSHADYDLPDRYGVSRSYRFSRDCLEVRLATDPPLTIFVNHFKSQMGSKKTSANKRRVQAEAVAELAKESSRQHPRALEVIMGDLNDQPESWALEPLFREFIDVFEDFPDELRVTHRSRHGGSSLDHILLSPDARSRMSSSQVWKDAAVRTSDHDPVSVEIQLDRDPSSR